MDRIETIKIAKTYRYLSDFARETGWELPNGILDKQITGAGATHLAITDRHPTIIVSPRRELIRNKCEQYDNLFWYEGGRTAHKDMEKFKTAVKSGIKNPKIIVTVDKFCRLLNDHNMPIANYNWHIVVDEYHTILRDIFYRQNVYMDMYKRLAVEDFECVTLLTATPLDETTNSMIPFVKDQKITRLDWECKEKAYVDRMVCNDTIECLCGLLKLHNLGGFIEYNNPKELIIFMNSMSMIGKVIERCDFLTPDNVNIVCADSNGNNKNALSALSRKLKGERSGEKFEIGKVPLKDEKNKTYTFCTSTAHFGVDFYSDCALAIVVCDNKYQYSVVNVDLDLPQILGRIRNQDNPNYNKCLLVSNASFAEHLDYKYLLAKHDETKERCEQYKNMIASIDEGYAKMLYDTAVKEQKKSGVDIKNEKVTVPGTDGYLYYDYDNKGRLIVEMDELRSRAMQCLYKDNITMFENAKNFYVMSDKGGRFNTSVSNLDFNNVDTAELLANKEWIEWLGERDTAFKDICIMFYDPAMRGKHRMLHVLNKTFKNKYPKIMWDLGFMCKNITKDKIKSMQYNLKKVDGILKPLMFKEDIKEQVNKRFGEVEFMSVNEVKAILQDIYDRNGLDKRAKATDISEFMKCKIIPKKINGTVKKVAKFK
jgi:hypothetical protein